MSVTRLIRILAILALLFSPLAMIGGHAAMAMPVVAQSPMIHADMPDLSGHCADQGKPSQDRPASSIDCMIACTALPTAAAADIESPMTVVGEPPLPRAAGLRGIHPESDPPPPRLS